MKILDELTELLQSNPSAKGKVDLFIDNAPCPSCADAILKFGDAFQNIDITVTYM